MPSGKQKIQSENILYINMDGNITPVIVISEREEGRSRGRFFIQSCETLHRHSQKLDSLFNVRVDLLKINICYRV